MRSEKVNWPLVLAVTIAGVTAVAIGLSLSEEAADAWSSIFIEIGAAIGLVSMLVLVERRVVRSVAVSTAREETERITTDLRGRIERLEDVDTAQEQRRAEQQWHAHRRLAEIRMGDVSSATIGDLLVDAVNDRLIVGETFRVRTSDDPLCPVLYMVAWVDPASVLGVFLDFEPVRIGGEIDVEGTPMPVPMRTDSAVLWTDEDAGEVGAELQAGLARQNKPAYGFRFGYSLEMLLKSVEVMRGARAATAGSPYRLEGKLEVLINDDWAYTSTGLEAIADVLTYPVTSDGFDDMGRGAGDHIVVPDNLETRADASLAAAIAWVKEREQVKVFEQRAAPAGLNAWLTSRKPATG